MLYNINYDTKGKDIHPADLAPDLFPADATVLEQKAAEQEEQFEIPGLKMELPW